VLLTGLVMIRTNAVGQKVATPVNKSRMTPAFVLKRSGYNEHTEQFGMKNLIPSRVIPGFRAIPGHLISYMIKTIVMENMSYLLG
jgi:hypothetical protein